MAPPRALRPELASVLNALFGEVPGFVPEVEEWVPRLDAEETEKALVIRVELPGIDPREVEVSVEEGVLFIKGEKKLEKELEEKNLLRRERLIGKFYRVMSLPRTVDAEKIAASSKLGVLTLTIPYKPEVKPRRIDVHAEG
jgi:HSP20 family protein